MKQVLDACCGSKMFYIDKNDERVLFMDKFPREAVLCDGRNFKVSPDIVADFVNMPFLNGSFSLVIFDPPHLKTAGQESYMAIKYGKLDEGWEKEIRAGFSECFRVLKPGGVLVFKWCEYQIPLKDVLALTDEKPIIGNRNPKGAGTHWIVFMKSNRN